MKHENKLCLVCSKSIGKKNFVRVTLSAESGEFKVHNGCVRVIDKIKENPQKIMSILPDGIFKRTLRTWLEAQEKKQKEAQDGEKKTEPAPTHDNMSLR